MVSPIPKCFRPRRARPENKMKLPPSVYITAAVEITSSSTDTDSGSFLATCHVQFPLRLWPRVIISVYMSSDTPTTGLLTEDACGDAATRYFRRIDSSARLPRIKAEFLRALSSSYDLAVCDFLWKFPGHYGSP